MKKPLTIFLYKTSFFALSILLLFEIFFRAGIFPEITAWEVFDLKMIYLQQHKVKNIKIMAIGSSVSLYGIEDSIIVKNFDLPFYNMATFSLQITDDEALVKTWVKSYKPQYVILCSVLSDFRAQPNSKILTYANTPEFIKNNFLEYFYFNDYQSISSLLHRRFFPPVPFVYLKADKWGGIPRYYDHNPREGIIWNEKEDKFPTSDTESNYKALERLSAFLAHERVKFIFIETPMANSRVNDTSYRKTLVTHFNRCKSIVESNNGFYFNHYNPAIFADSLFFDKVHLYARGAQIFTREVVKDLKSVIK